MAGPLQTDLRPSPPWLIRAVALAALVGALLILGLVNHARRLPPQLLLSGPHREFAYARAVERVIAAARTRIWMTMFVIHFDDDPANPATVLLHALAAASARGVHVQVCIDLGTDRQTGEVDTKHEAALAWMQAHGIKALLDELDRTTHAKALVVDDARVVVGSHNWTREALTGNREASVVLDDPAMAKELSALMREIPGWDAGF